jgi:hypothetical protein
VMREIVAAVRQAVPDASSQPPGAVLAHVLEALPSRLPALRHRHRTAVEEDQALIAGQGVPRRRR